MCLKNSNENHSNENQSKNLCESLTSFAKCYASFKQFFMILNNTTTILF